MLAVLNAERFDQRTKWTNAKDGTANITNAQTLIVMTRSDLAKTAPFVGLPPRIGHLDAVRGL